MTNSPELPRDWMRRRELRRLREALESQRRVYPRRGTLLVDRITAAFRAFCNPKGWTK